MRSSKTTGRDKYSKTVAELLSMSDSTKSTSTVDVNSVGRTTGQVSGGGGRSRQHGNGGGRQNGGGSVLVTSPRSPGARKASAGGQTQQRVKINAPYSYIEELAVSSPSERNWRGIFIALLVIVAVLGLILFSIILVSPPEEGPRNRGKKPTLEDIFLKLPKVARFNGTWISDSEFVYMDSSGGLSVYNAENQTHEVLVPNNILAGSVDYKVSSDLRHVLLISDVIHVNEYSTLARYHIHERDSKKRDDKIALAPRVEDTHAPHLQYAMWSPDGRAVAFVYQNDIYYKPIGLKHVCQITNHTASGGDVRSGVPDWLYGVEVLKRGDAMWFSRDSQWLMWLQVNDTKVGEYKFPVYGSGDALIKYPAIRTLKYPKVETPNPEVTVWVVNTTLPKYLFPAEVKPTNSVQPDSYVTSASFYGDHKIVVVWLNRQQNVSVIVQCEMKPRNEYSCTEIHVEKESSGWTEPILNPIMSYNGIRALVRLPVKDGNNGEFLHICQLYNQSVVPMTHGAFEVTQILAWDEGNHIIYALATNENNPGVRHLFRLGDDLSDHENADLPWNCMTCQPKIDMNATYSMLEAVTSDNTAHNETVLNETMFLQYPCEYNNVIFSHGYRYFVQECMGPEVPVVFLVDTMTNYRLAVLDSASRLRRKVLKLTTPRIKRLHVEIEGGFNAEVKLYLPPVLREYEDLTFPLVLLVDSWPGSQQVSEKWEISWPWYLATTRNYIVANIDVRGSGFQGEDMKKGILNGLGTIDVQDQLAVLTYLRDTFKFIDKFKICTVGKGYGGYVTSMMILQDINQVINCSISIAPISNWQYYNSYFTERYLGLPSENQVDYDRADLTKRAGNLKDRNFLLMHGTADTRVKPQHAMMFAKALVEQDILFHQVVYPDEDHEFTSKALIHMYKEINQFFNDSFGPTLDDWDDDDDFRIGFAMGTPGDQPNAQHYLQQIIAQPADSQDQQQLPQTSQLQTPNMPNVLSPHILYNTPTLGPDIDITLFNSPNITDLGPNLTELELKPPTITELSPSLTDLELKPPNITELSPSLTEQDLKPPNIIDLAPSLLDIDASISGLGLESEDIRQLSENERAVDVQLPGPSGLHLVRFGGNGKKGNCPTARKVVGGYQCGHCQKIFPNTSKLLKHQQTIQAAASSSTSTAPLKCDHCKKTFSSKFKLVRHALIHSDRRPFSCTVCNRTFHRKDHLKNHCKVHDHTKELYLCAKIDCKKEYTSHLSYKKHLALHAAEDGNLICQLCHKGFKTKDEVLMHLKVHAGSRPVKNPDEKKYRCDSCDRRFFTRKDVRRHEVVHTGMRDFLCQFCPERFGRKDHLIRHIKKLHYQQQQQQLLAAPSTSSNITAIKVEDVPAEETDLERLDHQLEHLAPAAEYYDTGMDFLFGSTAATVGIGEDEDTGSGGIGAAVAEFTNIVGGSSDSIDQFKDEPIDILEDLGSNVLEDIAPTSQSPIPELTAATSSSSATTGLVADLHDSNLLIQLMQQANETTGKLPAFDKIFQQQSGSSQQQKPLGD